MHTFEHFDPHLLLNEIKRKCSRVFPFLRLRCKFLYGRFCGDMMNTSGHQIVVWRHYTARMAVDDHNSNQSRIAMGAACVTESGGTVPLNFADVLDGLDSEDVRILNSCCYFLMRLIDLTMRTAPSPSCLSMDYISHRW
jgi:hypothetical protein